jgi:hypothetical protein
MKTTPVQSYLLLSTDALTLTHRIGGEHSSSPISPSVSEISWEATSEDDSTSEGDYTDNNTDYLDTDTDSELASEFGSERVDCGSNQERIEHIYPESILDIGTALRRIYDENSSRLQLRRGSQDSSFRSIASSYLHYLISLWTGCLGVVFDPSIGRFLNHSL